MFLDTDGYQGFALLDLDGTLFPMGTHEPSPAVSRALEACRAASVALIAVTGRPWSMLQYAVQHFDAAVYNDGASLFAGDTRTALSHIEPDAARSVIAHAQQHDLVLGGDGFGPEGQVQARALTGDEATEHQRIILGLPKGTASSHHEALKAIMGIDVHHETPLKPEFDVVRVMPPSVSKLTGVLQLLNRPSLPPNCLGLGDSSNDELVLQAVKDAGGQACVMRTAPADLLPHLPRIPCVANDGAALALQYFARQM